MTGPMLTQKEVLKLLRVSPKTLQNWRRTRKIRYVSFGYNSIRFRQEDVEDFISRHARREVKP